MAKKSIMIITGIILLLFQANCSSGGSDDPNPGPDPDPNPVINEVDVWLTNADKSALLKKQSGILAFNTKTNNYATIEVSSSQTYQTIDGFGFSLTGGSATAINSLSSDKKSALLNELFGSSENSIAISYLRVSIGASDLNPQPFSYDDMPSGETDEDLSNFSLEPDMDGVIAVLKEILAINPTIKILGSPWSAPVWMKDNNSTVGGSLQPKYYDVYARYFVKYIQAMKALGITLDAITIQNEPQHGGNNPSMVMSASQQADFVKDYLGPAFANASISTKIIIWDHNCDNPQYPITVLNDAGANQYVDGSAFHLYNGDISALSTVHNAFPDKNLYFTEQYTSSNSDFAEDLKWHLKNVIIGSMRNWSKNALEWNLASDENYDPHTDGGCTICKGGLTISSSGTITRNVGYYIIAHASKFVPDGAVRIASSIVGNLQSVAFKTPDGHIVLIVENDGSTNDLFNIKYNGKWITTSLNAGSVATYVWE